MKKVVWGLLVLFLFLPSIARAQTSASVQWNQPNLLADASGFQYTLKIDTAAPVTLTATCTTVNSAVQCSAPLTGYVPGPHALALSVTNATGTTATTTFNTGVSPGLPAGTKVIVIIIGN